MSILSNVNIDIIGLCILFIIFLYGKIYAKRQTEQKIFTLLIFFNGILLVIDILQWALDGKKFLFDIYILNFLGFLFYLCLLTIALLWLAYCDCKVITKAGFHFRIKIYTIPWVMGLIIYFISIYTGWVWYYDKEMIYHRGKFPVLHLILAFGYIAFSVIMIFYNAKKKIRLKRYDDYLLLIFVIPPLIGAMIQLYNFGLTLIPVSISISLFIVFEQRQSALITIDSLTGLNNRRVFENYIEQKLDLNSQDKKLFIMMIDVDFFKQINDNYGHMVGDEALIKIASILKHLCIKSDCLVRIGGDEFTIIGYRKNKEQIKCFCNNIHEEIRKENCKKENVYQLSLSVGYAIYDKNIHANLDAFLYFADQAMYKNKRKKNKIKES